MKNIAKKKVFKHLYTCIITIKISQAFIELFIMCNFQRFTLLSFAGLQVVGKRRDPSLFLADICCVLTPYSADKLVPFSPFFNHKIIDCLAFIEQTDRLRFKDMMIVNKHS